MATDTQRVKRRWKSFERKVAKRFSEWSGIPIQRVPMSGAWAQEEGDITSRYGIYFPFVVECKSSQDFSFDSILAGSKGFRDWLTQAREQAIRKTLESSIHHFELLVFSKPRYPYQVAVPKPLALKLGFVTRTLHSRELTVSVVHDSVYTYLILSLDSFLSCVSYDDALLVIRMMTRRTGDGEETS